MTDEVSTAEVPVPVEPTTAVVPSEAVTQPAVAAETPPETPKTFTQEEMDAAISKRLAREQRKLEREIRQQLEAERPQAPVAPVAPEQFESTEAYVEAAATQRAQQLLQQQEQQRRQNEVFSAYQDREEAAREKYEDYQQVALNSALPITPVMAEVIRESDIGPEIAYYLGSNIKEADRIAKLSPSSQAREIGKLEAKLEASPPTKKTSTAPAPIAPVNARTSGAPVRDTTDPRSVETMSATEWINAERARQRKKFEAAHR